MIGNGENYMCKKLDISTIDDLFAALQSINMDEGEPTDNHSKPAQVLKWLGMLEKRGFTIVKK